MSEFLVDQSGSKFSESSCPKCGNEKLEQLTMFGGYWKKICAKCGEMVSSGREA